MKTLPIVWQRLVDADGATCPRCRDTGLEIRQAFEQLKLLLAPLGVTPTLECREIAADAFQAAPLESNRIWIAGKPVEDWLDARVGSSRCCASCGDSECRTLDIEGAVFEAIPQDLLIRAALIAAAQLPDNPHEKEATMKVTVYGPGCARCTKTMEIVKDVLETEGIAFTLEKVSDYAAIAQAGIMATPGVAIDGKVVSVGKIPTVPEVKSWLK